MSFLNILVSMMGSSGNNFPVPIGTPSVQVINTQIIRSDPNRWFGRCSVYHRPDNIIILTYRAGEAHNINTTGEVIIRFSDDYGDTWSNENEYLDGTPIVGFPMYPVGSWNQNNGPVHGLLVGCPNGDILCQMWDHAYQPAHDWNGPVQSRSTDGGLTWSTPAAVTLNGTGVVDPDKLYIGEDHFVLGNDIYLSVREYRPDLSYEQMFMFKSSDNGNNYNYVGQMTTPTDPPPDGSGEIGFTYIGDNKITGLCRISDNSGIYTINSDDMGLTWTNQDISSSNPTDMGRSIIKSRGFAQRRANWWNDPVLIGCGMVFPTSGSSHPRQNSVFISKDFGANWVGPLYVDTEGYDGGYGDWFYNPAKDEYVYMTYKSQTDLSDGQVIQYNFKIIWS